MTRHYVKTVEAGFSIIELAVVMCIVGILGVLTTPFFLSYYQAARLRVGAEEVAALINQGRQLGIRQNDGVRVHIASTAVQYMLGITTLIGPGSDASGKMKLPEGITLTTNVDPVFSYLGAANPGATITVTNTQTGSALHVTVAPSGRVSIGP